MAPVIMGKGILFSSNRKNDIVTVTVDQEGNYMYNLYFSERRGEKNWTSAGLFSKDISTRYNESSAAISADAKWMVYTATINAQDGMSDKIAGDTLRNGLFFAEFKNDQWLSAGEFPFNSTAFNTAHPGLNSDASRLYFASDMPGGYGGYDIYYSDKTGEIWGHPVNSGPVINTSGNEVFPFVFNNNRLYFASDGHGGQGKVDIFYSDSQHDLWNSAVNLPSPFNSPDDDFAYFANAEMDTGFFTSNRRGSDDIYTFISTFPTFTTCPEQMEESYCFEFYETGSINLDTTSLKYEWDLGDGTKVRDLRADHCFDGPGNYLVRLNVIDTLTGEIFFSEASYDLAIEKVEQPYILAPDTAEVSTEIVFDAAGSNIRNFVPDAYYWIFGDGELGNEISTIHVYTKPGNYIVRLGLTGTSEESPGEKQKACVYRHIIITEGNDR